MRMAAPNAAPAGPSPSDQGKPKLPKASLGDVLDFPNSSLRGWTVLGMDTRTGRVSISRRHGEQIEKRSIDLGEYEQALQFTKQQKVRRLSPKPKFRLGDSFGLGADALHITGYDALTGSALVEGIANGQLVNTWVERNLVNEAVSGDAKALQKVREVVAPPDAPVKPTSKKDIPQAKGPTLSKMKKAATPESKVETKSLDSEEEQAEEDEEKTLETSDKKEVEIEKPVEEKQEEDIKKKESDKKIKEPPRPAKDISEIRKKIQEEREKRQIQEVPPALQSSLDPQELEHVEGVVVALAEKASAQLKGLAEPVQGGLPQEVQTLQAAKASILKDIKQWEAEEAEEDAELKKRMLDNRRELLEFNERRLKKALAEFEVVKVKRAKCSKEYKALNELVSKLKSSSNQKDRMASLQAIIGALPENFLKHEEEYLVTFVAKPGSDSGQKRLAEFRSDLSKIANFKQPVPPPVSATTSIALPTAVAAADSQMAQLLMRAKAGIQLLDNETRDNEKQLNQIRASLVELGKTYSELNQQRQSAIQQGNSEAVPRLDTDMQSLDQERRGQLDAQLKIQARNTDTRLNRDKLAAASQNLSQAESSGQGPTVLMQQVSALIPPTVSAVIAPGAHRPPVSGPSDDPQAALAPEPPKQPRSYAVSTPPIRQAATAASPGPGVAGGLRNKLLPTLGYGQATAVAIDASKQAELASQAGLGEDAYEKAMSTEGGHETRRQAVPSYTTQAPSSEEIEEEDLFDPERGGRQRQRAKEEQQREAVESLQPGQTQSSNEEAEGQEVPESDPEQSAEPAQAQSGLSPAEVDRSVGMQSARQNGILNRVKKGLAKEATGKSNASTQSNLQGVKKLKRGYDALKLGSALTFWGIVLTILTMNLQLIAKILDLPFIPKQSLIEDVFTVALDILLIINIGMMMLISLIVPATIAALIIGGGLGVAELASFVADALF